MHRRLTLHKETLSELVSDELTAVRAAQAAPTSPLAYCASNLLRVCDSLLRTCVTYTCTL